MAEPDDLTNGSLTLQGTSRNAERLIEQRIEELRALALGPMESGAAAGGWDTAPPPSDDFPPLDHPAPGDQDPLAWQSRARPRPEPHDAAFRPVGPVGPVLGHAASEAVATSISRLETAVQEDVARLELLLRSWGSPRDAARTYGEQVLGAVGELEQRLSAGLEAAARQLELLGRRPSADVPEKLIHALASWTVKLEQMSATQTDQLLKQLHDVARNLHGSQAEMHRATGKVAEAAAAASVQRITAAMDDLQRSVVESAEGRQLVVQAIDRTSNRVLRAVEKVESGLDDRTAHSERQLGQLHDEVRQLRRDLNETVIARLETALSGAMSQMRGDLREEMERVRAEVQTTTLATERSTREVLAAITAQQERFALALSDLEDRVDDHTTATRSITIDSVGQVSSAVESLLDRHRKDAQVTRDTMRNELSTMRHELIATMDQQRLKAAQQAETVVDTMAAGWKSSLALLDDMQERLTAMVDLLEVTTEPPGEHLT